MFRILFVPWPEDGAGVHLKADAEEWQAVAATELRIRKFFRIVYASPAPGVVASLALTGLGSTDTVFVMGHCNAGLDHLVSQMGGDDKLSYDQVCDRLIAHGLQPWFSGKLKFFNCSSGVPGADGSPSFLTLAGKYLRDKGYTACTIYGYDGTTSGYGRKVGDGADSEPPHKWVMQLVPGEWRFMKKRARDGQVIYDIRQPWHS
jgi:hypothetical protein